MHFRQVNDRPNTFVVIFEPGEEAMSGLTAFAREQALTASQITAIGGFERVVLGYFDRDKRDYQPIPIEEQVEVLSIIGDIVGDGDDLKVHAHVVVGRRDGSAHGGHLLEAVVWPTLEVVITETPAHLQRRFDPKSGAALIAM
jgi:predicted DNA-binding protein with PD1-like motif